jgi:hypothetical protein
MNSPDQSQFDVWRNSHFDLKMDYTGHKTSFVHNHIPEIALNLGVFDILQIFAQKFGSENLSRALNPNDKIESPVKNCNDGSWLKTSNMVGVNIRTIGNFFNLVKYLLTIGSNQDSVHILPIWEPGVVASLYGKTSWNINPEFFSQELKNAIPHLDTPAKQLKVVVNLVHLMGKTIGMDVIPHTDRFSELVFLYPEIFEWAERSGAKLVNVSHENAGKVENVVWKFLEKNRSANGSFISYSKEFFFDFNNPLLSDAQKLEVLFGRIEDTNCRLQRRLQLMQQVLYAGFETLPVTMAPPYRCLHLVENDYIMDQMGNKWYNYQFDEPEGMSRVFGPLTRYKFYHTISDTNQNLDFSKPNIPAWEYVCRKYLACQQEFNFDFMRGDMAHVQPRKDGVPKEIGEYYDPLKAIKKYVQKNGVPYFGFFAETFIAPPDTMGYGVEEDHLDAIEADSTLGDLQASPVGSELFMENLEKYLDLAETRKFAPNFTMITADKDDPRFDEFYKKGNHLRYFVGTFFPEMPSYMSLGFEVRNPHLERAINEEYTKLYVFQITDDTESDKVTHGPFVWGKNFGLFQEIEKMKMVFDKHFVQQNQNDFTWISKPAKDKFLMSWRIGNLVFEAALKPDLQLSSVDSSAIIYSSKEYSEEHWCRVSVISHLSGNNS